VSAGCKTCGLIGCECPTPETITQPRHREVCPACRRSIVPDAEGLVACICRSHVKVREVHDFSNGAVRREPTRPYTAKQVEVFVNDAMIHYYNRDAQGLATFVRKLAASA
jgi:hypothetical protein